MVRLTPEPEIAFSKVLARIRRLGSIDNATVAGIIGCSTGELDELDQDETRQPSFPVGRALLRVLEQYGDHHLAGIASPKVSAR
jgi:hypothetical protein